MPEAQLRERHRLGERQVALSLSAKRPHKNLIRLLDALALIPAERRPVLVIPGYRTAHEQELEEHARALGIEDDVRILGWLDEAEIEGLYALASCFVFPSLYEGFGLPVLEAMAARRAGGLLQPQLAARGGRRRRAAVRPRAHRRRSPRRWSACWPAARRPSACAQAGLERARQFTWDETARADRRELRAGPRLVGDGDGVERVRQRQPLGVAREPGRGGLAQVAARLRRRGRSRRRARPARRTPRRTR